ncbi:unnamed protein product, partial [Onchocerca flexuosa]|uniref:DUF4234 domain-containing protein n=1 Tax=Onchocerca flexuosa TaxID=387005 RepID=A0A183HQ73_9BILA
MTTGLLVLEVSAIFFLTLLLLKKYGNWRQQHFIVTVSTLIGWFFSFVIIFILPLDIAITFYNRCLLEEAQLSAEKNLDIGNITDPICKKPVAFVPNYVLLQLWRIVYWTAQILTWLVIVLPLMQSYSNAGDFSALGKLRSAIYNNAIYYGTYFIVFFMILIYAAVKGVVLNASYYFDYFPGRMRDIFREHLKVILISASNTWSLFLLVVLLGYGLIEVPRQFWQMGNR